MTGPIRRSTRTCVRCDAEPAQPPTGSVFALGWACLSEVHPRGTREQMRAQYTALLDRYGYRDHTAPAVNVR